jgi:hypothetical protein
MRAAGSDPIFVTPRMLPRRWGRADLGEWCANAPKPRWPIGEVWTFHPGNTSEDGRHVGARLSAAPQDMLGDLGRAPPALRLVFADAETDPLVSDAHVALWRILEAPFGARCEGGVAGAKPDLLRCRTGDAFRACEGGRFKFRRGVTALEARSSFAPHNQRGDKAPILRLPSDPKQARATLLRDAALSVELWRLPEQSRLEPDGETCHVLMALSDGVALDGRALGKGEAVFIPACGRRTHLFGRGAPRVLVAYPDLVPTAIWRHAPEPDRAAPSAPNPPVEPAPPVLMHSALARAA